jgi:hypothetical protein
MASREEQDTRCFAIAKAFPSPFIDGGDSSRPTLYWPGNLAGIIVLAIDNNQASESETAMK